MLPTDYTELVMWCIVSGNHIGGALHIVVTKLLVLLQSGSGWEVLGQCGKLRQERAAIKSPTGSEPDNMVVKDPVNLNSD